MCWLLCGPVVLRVSWNLVMIPLFAAWGFSDPKETIQPYVTDEWISN